MNVLSSGAGMGMMGTIIWIAVLLVFIFIFMLRPQKKEQARRNEMMAKWQLAILFLPAAVSMVH